MPTTENVESKKTLHKTFAIGKKEILEGMEENAEKMRSDFKVKLKNQSNKLIHHKPERKSLYYIFHLILNQRKLVYTTSNVLKYVFCCLVCRKSKSLRKLKNGKRDF
jgi:hypothetical protein